MIVTGWPNRNVVDWVETIPEFVETSDLIEVVVVTPAASKSEYEIAMPSSSINLSVTIIFISSSIVCIV